MPERLTVAIAAREAVRHAIRDSLTNAGFLITVESGNPADAIEADPRPHVVVLDRDLPAGPSTIAALATPARRPRLLVIGGTTHAADVRAARLAGADQCLPGAIDAERVVAAVAGLAAGSKGER